jgi:hypothetical protein
MAKASHLSIVRSADPNEPDDPIFAAIERERRSYANWIVALERQSALERGQPHPGQDHAILIEATVRAENKENERHAARVGLVTIYPTTTEGVVALLKYFAESASIDEGEYWSEEYGVTLASHAAVALERITRSA